MNIVFWINSISIHQFPLIKAVSEEISGEVIVVSSGQISSDRLALGWGQPDFGSMTVVCMPSDDERIRIETDFASSAVHIVSGPLTEPKIAATTLRLMKLDALILCQTEGWDSSGPKGAVRKLAFIRRFRRLSEYPKCGVLAMGGNGLRDVAATGFPADRSTEFGYFVESAYDTYEGQRDGIAFVGSLVKRKRVHDVLNLAGMLPDLRTSVIGDGPLLGDVKKAALRFPNIECLGPIANRDIHKILEKRKVLILPSEFDGWGAVVNEALTVGTSVICSNRVGAKSMLESIHPRRGVIVPVGDIQAMYDAATVIDRTWSGAGSVSVAKWAQCHISPARGAEHLVSICTEIFRSSRVSLSTFTAPWRSF